MHAGLVGAEKVQNEFCVKWRQDEELHAEIRHFVGRNHGPLEISHDDISAAFRAIKHQRKIDFHGASVSVYRLLYCAHEEQFRHCLQLFLSDSAWQREHESIQGRAYGKESSHPPANGVRCILPMSALGSICDFVLSSMLDRALEAHYRVPGSVIFGGRKGTQVADVAWASQLVIEKGCDSRSKSCIGSADIEKFYDSLPMLQIGLYLRYKMVWGVSVIKWGVSATKRVENAKNRDTEKT